MKDKDLLKLLLKNGWKVVRISGSHHILEKEGFMPISLPVHGKDMKVGLEVAILKHAKLK
ncbi:MAG: type II toxin-antitoxin system HicA family toxin [Treponema sp.]|jgi:predicted RNA binding protein YcfA (HicA-like mRNA interferase family)|nr:type II toxin-antitoxin system HicA family toxin [Treponema sp.]